ncbi:hypothetical protein TcG_06337 [Trypanosoma cruzi]|nr:hypothetical protein TcG_06337 [Trypanosoma cruzi]
MPPFNLRKKDCVEGRKGWGRETDERQLTPHHVRLSRCSGGCIMAFQLPSGSRVFAFPFGEQFFFLPTKMMAYTRCRGHAPPVQWACRPAGNVRQRHRCRYARLEVQ